MELILESDSDGHLSEEEDICVQIGSDTGDTDTSHSGLTIQTVDILYLLPTSSWGIPAGYNEQSRPASILLPTECFHALLF
jgi:hypothetical protein